LKSRLGEIDVPDGATPVDAPAHGQWLRAPASEVGFQVGARQLDQESLAKERSDRSDTGVDPEVLRDVVRQVIADPSRELVSTHDHGIAYVPEDGVLGVRERGSIELNKSHRS
jgi:hypothetical protein